MALPTLQSALQDGFAEAVMACDMPEPCNFPSHDSCQKRFLLTHKEVDLAPHLVVGLVLQVEDEESFLKYVVSKAWITFVHSQHTESVFHSHGRRWR